MSTPRQQLKKFFVAADHAGFELKEKLKQLQPELPWEDFGPFDKESVDYPDYADLVAKKVEDPQSFGLLICGSGQGMAIRANRYPHVRAALCMTEELARLSRQHNKANVLCLGSRFISESEAAKILNAFLDTDFEDGDRHARRVEKLRKLPE